MRKIIAVRAIVLSIVVGFGVVPVQAFAATFKIGLCVALVGNNATVDRAWRDSIELAVEVLNAAGGVNGDKIELLVEDNRSEPQEAALAYRKLLDDGAQIILGGSNSAGNAAGAPLAAKAEVPIIALSVIPQREELFRWFFSSLVTPRTDIGQRLHALQTLKVTQVGVLTDPTPYAALLRSLLNEEAGKYGVKLIGEEQYKQADADLSVAITKLHAQGAAGIVKTGVGPSTLTAAKNLKQLQFGIPMVNWESDFEVAKNTGQVLGKDFIAVIYANTIFDYLPAAHPARASTSAQQFIARWRQKFGERDPGSATFGWDAAMMAAAAATKAKSTNGAKLRDAIEELQDFAGAGTFYTFSKTNHFGLSKTPFVVARWVNDKFEIME